MLCFDNFQPLFPAEFLEIAEAQLVDVASIEPAVFIEHRLGHSALAEEVESIAKIGEVRERDNLVFSDPFHPSKQ